MPFRFVAPAEATHVVVAASLEEGTASCEASAPYFECLLDLSLAEPGADLREPAG